MDLNNSNERDSVIQTLKLGQDTDFWNVVKQGIENNLKHLEKIWESEEHDELEPSEYKSRMQNLKYRKKIWQTMLKLPEVLINQLERPNQEEPDLDPYGH